MWEYTPVIVLEKIYAMLSLTDRYACSCVCRHWYDVFRSARLWRHLKIGRRTFTRRKLRGAYLRASWGGGEEYEVNHWRFQMYLGVFGHHCRRLTILPIDHFYNLFEFMRVVSCFLEFFDDYPMPLLEQVEFTLACEQRYGPEETRIHGTGGQILGELRRLIADVRHLSSLSINHLLLDLCDATTLLDDVIEHSRESLRSLQLLNATRL